MLLLDNSRPPLVLSGFGQYVLIYRRRLRRSGEATRSAQSRSSGKMQGENRLAQRDGEPTCFCGKDVSATVSGSCSCSTRLAPHAGKSAGESWRDEEVTISPEQASLAKKAQHQRHWNCTDAKSNNNSAPEAS